MKAIKVLGKGDARLVDDANIPELRDDYILIKTHSVAVNPADYKHIDWIPSIGAIVGCDYAGTVVKVGPKVTRPFKPGDHICGAVLGSNELNLDGGAFAEYIVAKGDVQMKIPDNMAFDEASTLGVAVLTVGQGLYQGLGLPLPNDEEAKGQQKSPHVLICGGSSAMGMMAIQYAKLSGLTVHTTCSPKNFDLVKSLGADTVFDYCSETCGSDIRERTNHELHHVLDTIGEDGSPEIARHALAENGNHFYASLAMGREFSHPNTTSSFPFAYTASGERTEFDNGKIKFEASEDDFQFAKMFVEMSEKLLVEGKIKPLRMRAEKGGLRGVLQGIDDLRQKKVSAEKLVYPVDEKN